MKRLIFKQMQSPGDLLMLTVAIRDLHLRYPGWFKTDVISCYPEVFWNNRYIEHLPKGSDIQVVNMDYGPYLHILRQKGLHFSECFIYMLNEKLRLRVCKTKPKPHIELTKSEKSGRLISCKFGLKKPYWLLNAGIKTDIPLKQYPPALYQKVVYMLNKRDDFDCNIVQVGHNHHIHPKIEGVTSLVGKTNDLRDYFTIMYHAEGSIGPISLQMHLAAALNKPCVVLAGGREEPSWEMYQDHAYLHSIGKLECCELDGCWKKDRADCPTITENQIFPKCMTMIEPETVISEVMHFHKLKHTLSRQIYN